MGVDRKTVVRGIEHLCERDEVKEDCGDGGGNGNVTPAGAVVESRGKNCKGGDTVEDDCDFEPEEGH